ncbi:unnamed protein product [Parnassius mnemosyne]|uniref:Uncharacterized protein n=1 Tax=Parnassius mnemosyne TaxID=213953 RepID=A0AAV1M0Q4_9NEOP
MQQPKAVMVEELGKSHDPDIHLPPVSHAADQIQEGTNHVQEGTSYSLHTHHSEEFIYSSSSWQDFTESIEMDSILHSNENNVKKTKKKISNRKKKSLKDNNFDDTKENSKPKMKERQINKNKLRTHLKNSGKQYTSILGKDIAEKKMKSNTCALENCHNECYNISSDKRKAIFKHYWSLNNK